MIAYPGLSEAELIERINQGDIAVFEVLIRRHNPYLYKVGRSYGFNQQDVEDLMQETFIKAFENLKKLENKEFFKTWLMRIMLNECYKKKHKAATRKETADNNLLNEKTIPMFSGNNDTEKNILNREMNKVIENAIQQIPTSWRVS